MNASADDLVVERPVVVMVDTARFVRLPLAQAKTGYTVRAMQTKIDRGVWLEKHEFIRAPDGSILIDMRGYELWAAGQRRAG